MKQEKRKNRMGLTLLVAALVLVIQLASLLVAVGLILLLIRTGVLPEELSSVSTLLMMAGFSMVTSVIVASLIGKIYMQPVNRFVDQMNRLAAGDLKARIRFGRPISAHPTFQEVEDSFNTAAEELERTELLRSGFVNDFSHEFKTPIVSIAGFAKLLRREDLTQEQRMEYLAIIEEESLRLSHMATSVLELNKIENQTILTNVRRSNVAEQVRSAILLLEDKWTKKSLELELAISECETEVNEELLKHVWIDLLDNAIKFSEEFGCVWVTVEEKDAQVVVSIANTGKDIPPESLKRIFNKFYQVDGSRATQGNGIGLAIVKKVVDLHKGTVTVSSQGGRTVFTVRLPKGRNG